MVRFDRVRVTSVYERDALRPGDRVRGPAVVTQLDATTVMPPGWRGAVHRNGTLVLEPA
jgi:N-methylhydantoinase A/oxoprolinase/acetone carboxylase beta subunit